MNKESACRASSPRFNSYDLQMFFLLSSLGKGGRKEIEPVMTKLHDLVSPSRRNQVLPVPSMDKCSVIAWKGN